MFFWNEKTAYNKGNVRSTSIYEVTADGGVLVSHSGEVLVAGILENTGFYDALATLRVIHPGAVYTNASILGFAIASACRGESDFVSIEDYLEAPEFYGELFHGNIPSEATYRQRLNELSHDPFVEHLLWDWNAQRLIGGQIITAVNGYYNLDFDVTPTDEGNKTHKENLGNTYKKTIGYAPMIAYLGKEQYIINAELRPGKQHCQKGTVDFLGRTIDYVLATGKIPSHQLLIRMDSGNDAVDNYGVCIEKGVSFLVKGNRRQMKKEDLLAHAKEHALPENITVPRDGKTVYIGSDWVETSYFSQTDKMKKAVTLRMVYEVTERTSDAKTGQMLLIPDIEANIYWTNTDISDAEIIEWYHEHGSIEQGHAELKSDQRFNKLPSQTYCTNGLMFAVGCIGYNIDHVIGMEMYEDSKDCPLRKPAFRRRVKTVIKHIINLPGRVVRSGRRLTLDLGKGAGRWAALFQYMFRNLCFA